MSEALQDACMNVLDSSSDDSPRERDTYITMLLRVANSEHRKLTVNDDGVSYRQEFSCACQDFILDCYFDGRHPSADIPARDLVAKARRALSSMLCDTLGLPRKGHLYADELSELRVQLMARESLCVKLEEKLGGASGKKLWGYRAFGYNPASE